MDYIFAVCVLGMAYIDYDMAIESVAYIVLLNIGLTCIFLILLFKRSKIISTFYNNKEIEEIKHKELAENPFQQEMVDYLYRKLLFQKKELLNNKFIYKRLNNR